MKLKNELRTTPKNSIQKIAIFLLDLKRFHVFKKIIDNKISGSKKMN